MHFYVSFPGICFGLAAGLLQQIKLRKKQIEQHMNHLRGEFTKITALHLLCIILTLMGLLAKSQKQASHTIAMFVLWDEPSFLSNFSELAPPLHGR